MSRSVLLVVAVALIEGDGRVLLSRRPEGKPMAGLWEFPGGKLANGETSQDALIRELQEELGIVVTKDALEPFAFAAHDTPEFHLLMPLFICRAWQGEPSPLEGQSLAWVLPADLASYPMPAADVPLAKALLKELNI